MSGSSTRAPYRIAVTSGKGGVGKTNISVNLGLALQKQGKRVALFDADLALANAHIVMGAHPKKTVVDALGEQTSLADIATEGPLGVKLIAGGNGLAELMDLSHEMRHQIVSSLGDLAPVADYVIIDTPAGIESNVVDFVSAADRKLVVVVGEPAAFIDAYACIKVLHQTAGVNHFDIVVNRVRDDAHGADVFRRFQAIAAKFLTCNLYHVASIPEDAQMLKSIGACSPVVMSAPQSKSARALEALAKRITGPDATPVDEGVAALFAAPDRESR